MELLEAKRKKFHFKKLQPLSIKSPIKAYYSGFSVVVTEPEDVQKLNRLGFYGKTNLSRNVRPMKRQTEIIRKRQFVRRNQVELKKQAVSKVIVVPDSDSENGDYFVNLQPEFQIDNGAVRERLHLMLEEAFYLQDVLKCLKIENVEDLWKLFYESDKYFAQNYVVYRHFRKKNWIVKSGLKFGGDFCKELNLKL